MTDLAPWLIFGIRLIVPLAILRWPFWGMLAAIAGDASGVIIADALGWGFGTAGRYHLFDKIFDLYVLAFAYGASFQWPEVKTRRTASVLFFWRAAGLAAFEITGARQAVFFGPNIFENFYLLIAGLRQFAPAFRVNTARRLVIILAIAAIPKIIQEYIMHYLEFPTWLFIKTQILRWQ